MPNIRNNRRLIMRRRVSGVSLDTDYLAWRSAVGSVGATQETATNALIVSLKAHSLWTTLDRLFLFASENSTQALKDIKSLSTATNNGATFTASQGYAGNGTSTYVDTGFAGSSGVNFTQNSASLSVYIRTNRTTSANKEAVGAVDSATTGNVTRFAPYWGGNVIIYPLNVVNGGPSFDQFASVPATAQGMWTVSRTGSTTTDIYRNSSSTSLNTSAATSGSTFAVSFYIGAGNNSGSGEFFSDDEVAIAAFGAGLSNTNAAQFQTDINTYMTALGKNVY